MELRPYQRQAVDDLRTSIAGGARSPLLVASCGSGKTHIAKSIIESAVSKGKRVLFLAPRRELIYQTSDKLTEAGVEHGMIMAGEGQQMFAPVQVACVPTLFRRVERAFPPPADLIILDEAHLAISRMTETILKQYPNAVRIGLTATPSRTDGQGLGVLFDDLVMGPSITDLTAQGWLVPVTYFGPSKPDLEGVKIQMGDYNQKELGKRMDDPVLVGDVVTNWLRIASDRQTVVFSVNVAHSRHLCERFQQAGVNAEHLDAKTPNEERRAILDRVKTGRTQVICNCDVLSYGWDSPAISCAILARPTKSVARYLQAAGRVLRPSPGKVDTIIIDHTGTVEELGFVEDDRDWTLDGKENGQRTATRERKEPQPLTCRECSTIFSGAAICPECGHSMVSERKQAIDAVDADLQKIDRKKKSAENRQWSKPEKQAFYSGLLGIAGERGYKQGWAAMKYKDRLGVWPNSLSKQPSDPSPETRSWVKSRQIAWAKRKDRENA